MAAVALAVALASTGALHAQSIRGRVLDAAGAGVPFANVFVVGLNTGAAADADGAYYLRLREYGDYQVVVSAVGYRTRTDTVVVRDGEGVFDFRLAEDAALLDEIVVRAARRDSGYAIMREVAARRRDYLRGLGNYTAELYVKAREDTERVEGRRAARRRRRRALAAEAADATATQSVDALPGGELADPTDPLAAEAAAAAPDTTRELNLTELQVRLHHEAPDRYKEERLAVERYGDQAGLWLPTFGEADFNFYRARVDFGALAKTTIVSPLSPVGVLNYRFRHVATRREGGRRVYEVAFEPRKRGNATASGTLVVNDGLFNLRRVEATLPRGALRFFDALSVEQDYAEVADSVWLPTRQTFRYATRQGQRGRYEGATTIAYRDVEIGVRFPRDFWRGEVAVTEQAAYERDSTYWRGVRPVALAPDERERARRADSIAARVNSVAYKDSLQAAYNRVTALELLWNGMGFRRHRIRQHVYLISLPGLASYNVIGGWRVGPYVTYSRRAEDWRFVRASVHPTYGLRRRDLIGEASVDYRYDPHRLATVSLDAGREYASIFAGDGIRNQLSRSNYILADRVGLAHTLELRNGLYLTAAGAYADRRPVPVEGSASAFSELLDDEAPIQFDPYQAFTTRLRLDLTPFQRYLTEPDRKVVIGSAWPTLSLTHLRGWDGPLDSDIDFDYVELGLRQRVAFGALGNLRYTARAGRFLQTRDLRFVDVKRFRRADPILYFDPDGSFQSLDTSLSTARPFFELHALHYFNGALVNTLPLVRRTRVEAVAGAGALWLREGGFRHQEIFAGLERVFKVTARRRLRLGVYAVLGDSSGRPPRWEPKISIDLIDTWQQDWSY